MPTKRWILPSIAAVVLIAVVVIAAVHFGQTNRVTPVSKQPEQNTSSLQARTQSLRMAREAARQELKLLEHRYPHRLGAMRATLQWHLNAVNKELASDRQEMILAHR